MTLNLFDYHDIPAEAFCPNCDQPWIETALLAQLVDEKTLTGTGCVRGNCPNCGKEVELTMFISTTTPGDAKCGGPNED
jgi:hypothetical protein